MITQRLTKNPTKRVTGRRDGVEESGGDPYFANVVYLQNTWALTDVTGKAGTLVGNAAFSGGGLVCDGTGDHLNLNAASSAFSFGTGDFTIEWYGSHVMTGSSFRYVMDCSRSGSAYDGWFIYFDTTNMVVVAAGPNPPDTNVIRTVDKVGSPMATAMNDGLDHYWAVKRESGAVSVWLDGVSYSVATLAGDLSTANFIGTNYPLWLGGVDNGVYEYQGTLKNLRITKGVARDVSSIPTFPFPEA
jgi:hypothetical protein